LNYQQDDWDEWLPEAKAAINANPSETTGISLFFATNGYKPRMTFDLQPAAEELAMTTTPSQAKEQKRVEKLAQEIKKRSEFLQEQIVLS
jgi:hypothetical protein